MAEDLGLLMEDEGDAVMQRTLLQLMKRLNLMAFRAQLQGSKVDPAVLNSCLEQACQRPGNVDFVTALLEAGADPNSSRGMPVLDACRLRDFPLLKLLLQQPGVEVNLEFAKTTMTVLNFLCGVDCKHNQLPLLLECLALLLDKNELEVNKPDGDGNTAIMCAVENNYEDRVKLLLEQKKHVLNLNALLPIAGKVVGDIILARFPDLEPLLPPPLLESIEDPDPQKQFLAALQHKNIELFKNVLTKVDVNHFYSSPYYSTCLELACQSSNSEEFVKLLLDNGADPVKYMRVHTVPLVHYVVASCNVATLDLLIKDGRVNVWDPDGTKHTPLQVAANRRDTGPEDSALLAKCTERLLELADPKTPTASVNNQDQWGDTALHDSSRYGNDQITLLLLRHGASLTIKNKDNETPLVSISPVVLKEFLDERVSGNDYSILNELYMITFDYSFLKQPQPPKTSNSNSENCQCEMDPLVTMTKPNMQHLIQHPVINSFLQLKWQHIRPFYILDILLHMLFVLSMSIYVLLIIYDKNGAHYKSSQSNDSGLNYAPSKETYGRQNYGFECLTNTKSLLIALYIFRCLYAGSLYILIMREVVQLFVQKIEYIRCWRNYVDILAILTSLPLLVNPCLGGPWDLHVAAISVMLAWMEFILLTGSLPSFAVQLMMLRYVAATFLRFMLWYSLILIPFAICFHVLFGRRMEHFGNPLQAGLKTVSMFTGELNSGAMEFSTAPGTTHLVFFLFVFLVAVVLHNLINGLAVSDTQRIQNNAKVLSLVELVHLLARMEKSLHAIATWSLFPGAARESMAPRIHLFSGTLRERPRIQVLPNRGGRVKLHNEDLMDPHHSYHLRPSIIEAANTIIGDHNKKIASGLKRSSRRK